MAFKKKGNKAVFAVFMVTALMRFSITSAENFDCKGKAFYCLNSTHFMICVDLGDGVSKTVDDFLIPCPPPTVCMKTNNYECEYSTTTTTQFQTSKIYLSEGKNGEDIENIKESPFNFIAEDAEITTILPFWYKDNIEKFEQYYNTARTVIERSQYSDNPEETKTTTEYNKASDNVFYEITKRKNIPRQSVVSDSLSDVIEEVYKTTSIYENYFDTVSTTTLSDLFSTSQALQESFIETNNLFVDKDTITTKTITATTPSYEESFDIKSTAALEVDELFKTINIPDPPTELPHFAIAASSDPPLQQSKTDIYTNRNSKGVDQSKITITTISNNDDSASMSHLLEKTNSISLTKDIPFPIKSGALEEIIPESFISPTDSNGIVETSPIISTIFNHDEIFDTASTINPLEHSTPLVITQSEPLPLTKSTRKGFHFTDGLLKEPIPAIFNLPTDSIGKLEMNDIMTYNLGHFDTASTTRLPQHTPSLDMNTKRDLPVADDIENRFSLTSEASEVSITESLNSPTNSLGIMETSNVLTTTSEYEGYFNIINTTRPVEDITSNVKIISDPPEIAPYLSILTNSEKVFSSPISVSKELLYNVVMESKGIAEKNNHMLTINYNENLNIASTKSLADEGFTLSNTPKLTYKVTKDNIDKVFLDTSASMRPTKTVTYNLLPNVRGLTKKINIVAPTSNDRFYNDDFDVVSTTLAEVDASEVNGVSDTTIELPYLKITGDEEKPVSTVSDALHKLITETNNNMILTDSKKKVQANNNIRVNSNHEEYLKGYDNTQGTGHMTISYDIPVNSIGILQTNDIVPAGQNFDKHFNHGTTSSLAEDSSLKVVTKKFEIKDSSTKYYGNDGIRKSDAFTELYIKALKSDIDVSKRGDLSNMTNIIKDNIAIINGLQENTYTTVNIDLKNEDVLENAYTQSYSPLENKYPSKETSDVHVTANLNRETFGTEYVLFDSYDVLKTPSVGTVAFKNNNYETTFEKSEYEQSPLTSNVLEKTDIKLGTNNLDNKAKLLDDYGEASYILPIQETIKVFRNITRNRQNANLPSTEKTTKVLKNSTRNKYVDSYIDHHNVTISLTQRYSLNSHPTEVTAIHPANINSKINYNDVTPEPKKRLTINDEVDSTTKLNDINYSYMPSTNLPLVGILPETINKASSTTIISTNEINTPFSNALSDNRKYTTDKEIQENVSTTTSLLNLRTSDVTSSLNPKHISDSGNSLVTATEQTTISPDTDYQANQGNSHDSNIIHKSTTPVLKEDIYLVHNATSSLREIKINVHNCTQKEPENDTVLQVNVSIGNVTSAGLVQATDSQQNQYKANQRIHNPLTQDYTQYRQNGSRNHSPNNVTNPHTTLYHSAQDLAHTTLAPVNRAYDFSCFNRFRGKYSALENCTKFYICIGRLYPIIGQCPINTVYSDILKQCTRNLSHCVRGNQFKCTSAGRFSDILARNVYYICVRSGIKYVRFKLRCQKGYILNKTSVTCIEDIALLVTSTKYDSMSKGSSSSSVDSRSGSYPEKSKKRLFVCVKEGIFPDPHDCRVYYRCTKSNKAEFRRRKKKCDSDEVFHKRKKKCVDAESYECDKFHS